MRLVVTSDTHYPVKPSLIPDGDVFLHCGDLQTSGYPDEWARNSKWLGELPHKIKLLVPGNHDAHLAVYPGPALQDMRKLGVHVVGLPGNENFYTYDLPNGMKILGLPYVKNLPRWSFNSTEEEIFAVLQRMPKCDIVASHAPIAGFLDMPDNGRHKLPGIHAYYNYLLTHSPKYWFHGHIHEQYGQAEFMDTKIYNVAMSDRNHQHANAPIVIDL
jgi:Icc-related predicted phosphoesterase